MCLLYTMSLETTLEVAAEFHSASSSGITWSARARGFFSNSALKGSLKTLGFFLGFLGDRTLDSSS
jgi:hypothetical protein